MMTKNNNKNGSLQYMEKEAQVSWFLFNEVHWEMLTQLLLDQSRNISSGKENRQPSNEFNELLATI